MSKFGTTAILAVDIIHTKRADSPNAAWDMAALRMFPESPPSREKDCPKSAFLGLCEEGLIKGVTRGRYTRSRDNKHYALTALSLLRDEPALANDESVLWKRVQGGKKKTYNQQMHVVTALWKKGYIA